MKSDQPQKWAWYQEYKTCSCSDIQHERKNLLGYCRRHMNKPRRTMRIPADNMAESDYGFCEA